MRFFRKAQVQEAPCPRCQVTVSMDATECPVCGLNLKDPTQTSDGWSPPIERAEGEPPRVDPRVTSFR